MLVVLIAAALCTGCGTDRTSPKGIDSTAAATVTVTPADTTVFAGDSLLFTATVRDLAGHVVTGGIVTWSWDNPTSLSIAADGHAHTSLGTTTNNVVVTASIDGKSGHTQLTINGERLSTWPDTNALYVGMARALAMRSVTWDYSPELAVHIAPVTASSWSSSDNGVATVGTDGTVTAIGVGHSTITSKAPDGRTATAEVYVIGSPSLRLSSLFTEVGMVFTDARLNYSADCGLNAADGGLYCWGQFGALWGETVFTGGGSLMQLPANYVDNFDRCEETTHYFFHDWLERTRCSEIPVRLFPSNSFTSLAGWFCGLDAGGAAYCWGSNRNGGLGIGVTDTLKHGPTAVGTSERFKAITPTAAASYPGGTSAAQAICGLRGDGVAFCWGGAFGSTPLQMKGSVRWDHLADTGPCGIATDSTAYCWTGSDAPVQVSASMHWTDVVVSLASPLTRCGLTAAGTVYCWPPSTGTPIQATGAPALAFLSVETWPLASFGVRICGLTAAGDMYCVSAAGSGSSTTYAFQPRGLGGLKLKRFWGQCGTGFDDKIYCWTGDPSPVVKLVPGQ